MINLDVFAFSEVDIVPDAGGLPINDDSVNGIINIAMLEHVPNPKVIVSEMYRILKPGGRDIANMPWIQPYHAAPHDYHRWIQNGAKELFSIFNHVRIILGCGPTT